MLNKYTNVAILLVLLGAVVGIIAGWWNTATGEKRSVPVPTGSVLDLSAWDFGKQGAVKLDGEWAFYWDQLLDTTNSSVLSREPEPVGAIVQVPNIWSNYRVNGETLPCQGFATYRLTVDMGKPSGELALKLPTLSTACKVIVDGKMVAECGRVASSTEEAVPRYVPQVVRFQPNEHRFELIIQVSNYMYNSGGIWYSLYIGTEEQLNTYRHIGLAFEMMMFGTFLIMGMYHIFIYFQRRQVKTPLLFGIGCLIGAARLLFIGELFILDLLPELGIPAITMIGYLTYYGGIMVFVHYLRVLYPEELSVWITRLVTAVSTLFMLSVLATPISFYTDLVMFYHYFMLLISVLLVRVVWLTVKRRRDGAGLQCFGICFFLLTFVIDIASNAFYVSSMLNHSLFYYILGRQTVLLGLLVLVFVQAVVLTRRYAKAYQTIEDMSQKLIAQDRLKDEFLINTSHEFLTPLHGIMNISQAMMEGAKGELNETQKDALKTVISVARRLSKLVGDILDFSKLKNNELVLNRKSVSLQAIMQVNLEVFRYLIEHKPVRLEVDIAPDLPPAFADENRLQQILYNLIGNAAKFTERGRIIVSAAEKGDMLEVCVSDTGQGIEEDKRELIFQSFEQVGAAVSREYGGAGLGLSITKRLVELNGGQLSVDSTWGVGSTFTFTVPAGKRREGEADNALAPHMLSSRHRFEAYRGGRGKALSPADEEIVDASTILSVDDDSANQQVIMSVLAQEPYRIITAENGEEALHVLSSGERIDLVILDVMMPGMSGYETAVHMRKTHSMTDLPILMVTVKHAPEDFLKGFSSGANDFLSKPFHSHELRARVRTLLELKRTVEQTVQLETNFLRAQIKPHFLYNALNTIVGICPRDPKKASELLKKLSHYLRGSFDFQMKEPYVSIRKELELPDSYAMIEKARFKERLQLIYRVDVSLDVLLPPLSIQPLVENAIRHGVMKRIEGGQVTVTVERAEEDIRIVVADDGVGIPEHKRALLLQEDRGGQGVGLINIHQRLLRTYGNGLEIESTEGAGTKVTIRLPMERKVRSK